MIESRLTVESITSTAAELDRLSNQLEYPVRWFAAWTHGLEQECVDREEY